MVCCSYSCPKYSSCKLAVQKEEIEYAINYASFSCGKKGNFKLFEPITILCEKCKTDCSNDYFRCNIKHNHDGLIDERSYNICYDCKKLLDKIGLFAFEQSLENT